jgi:hypothetical protein
VALKIQGTRFGCQGAEQRYFFSGQKARLIEAPAQDSLGDLANFSEGITLCAFTTLPRCPERKVLLFGATSFISASIAMPQS